MSDRVELFTIALDRGDRSADAALLTADESARAARFVFAEHRRRFIASRAGLRRILAAYTGRSAAALTFTVGPYGKPGLPFPGVDFNLSHSHELALVGVRRAGPVGVDIEWPRLMDDPLTLAQTVFAPAERTALAALPPDERLAAFFRVWTRKEAFIKAIGTGFSERLERFEVSLGLEAHVLHVEPDVAQPASSWTLRSLELASGYVAAVAVPAPGVAVELRDKLPV